MTSESCQSAQLHLFRQLIEHGLSVFDGQQAVFIRWLRSPRPSLDNATPISLMDTMVGLELVENELSRIEEGMIS